MASDPPRLRSRVPTTSQARLLQITDFIHGKDLYNDMAYTQVRFPSSKVFPPGVVKMKSMKMMKKAQAGFTLIELMIVVA
ncbi:prepilin-type N-terminal cleavage/methylation domain-containing protein, partial [Massilia sp. DJPM01]|uniref:prepilin-type N-terminal cleavage/methylation domain-containing protein n=1 Tax=Massilia sp. DJPM01 TaxID=3024404 RepID=UPI00259F0A13